jgi:hypothetical protein
MKNSKLVGFFALSLDFLNFHFFKIFQIFKKLSRPIFSEPTELFQTGFVDFHKNRSFFINIVIHDTVNM